MSRQISRSDRMAQMSKQEELIAKKKLEILEKQRFIEMAKVIANQMNKTTTSGSDTESVKPPTVVVLPAVVASTTVPQPQDTQQKLFANTFNNDGSFLENFKKVTEAVKFKQESHVKTENDHTDNTNDAEISIAAVQSSQNVETAEYPFVISPPPPSSQSISSADNNLMLFVDDLQQLQSIPPPKPYALNEIPEPKELDLNAIPKPELNLDAIQIPDVSSLARGNILPEENNSEKVFSDNSDIPSTVDQLIKMVAEKGDNFEDKLCLQKNNVDSSLWFLFSKESEAYRIYRRMLAEYCESNLPPLRKYDPSDIYKAKNDDTNDSDSDSEYMKEAKQRNLINMKRKITLRSTTKYYSSDSDDDDDDDMSDHGGDKKSVNDITDSSGAEEHRIATKQQQNKIKKSRWGGRIEMPPVVEPLLPILPMPPTATVSVPLSFENQLKPLLKGVTRTDPALLNYARQNFGTIELSEEDWRKAEEHFKINLLYQDMVRKRQEIDQLARKGKFKYEYDSDEDTTGGTWEHKLRSAEMEATTLWAEALNKQSEGKHHIGDFLPPEELKKFMEQYDAKKNNREPDLSDYKEYKLKEDNIGFQMLQKLGWKEGQGLGAGGSGIVDPINKASQRDSNQGLGIATASMPGEDENEYDAYRRRMMLAYRFRPNPLNNPRRAYY